MDLSGETSPDHQGKDDGMFDALDKVLTIHRERIRELEDRLKQQDESHRKSLALHELHFRQHLRLKDDTILLLRRQVSAAAQRDGCAFPDWIGDDRRSSAARHLYASPGLFRAARGSRLMRKSASCGTYTSFLTRSPRFPEHSCTRCNCSLDLTDSALPTPATPAGLAKSPEESTPYTTMDIQPSPPGQTNSEASEKGTSARSSGCSTPATSRINQQQPAPAHIRPVLLPGVAQSGPDYAVLLSPSFDISPGTPLTPACARTLLGRDGGPYVQGPSLPTAGPSSGYSTGSAMGKSSDVASTLLTTASHTASPQSTASSHQLKAFKVTTPRNPTMDLIASSRALSADAHMLRTTLDHTVEKVEKMEHPPTVSHQSSIGIGSDILNADSEELGSFAPAIASPLYCTIPSLPTVDSKDGEPYPDPFLGSASDLRRQRGSDDPLVIELSDRQVCQARRPKSSSAKPRSVGSMAVCFSQSRYADPAMTPSPDSAKRPRMDGLREQPGDTVCPSPNHLSDADRGDSSQASRSSKEANGSPAPGTAASCDPHASSVPRLAARQALEAGDGGHPDSADGTAVVANSCLGGRAYGDDDTQAASSAVESGACSNVSKATAAASSALDVPETLYVDGDEDDEEGVAGLQRTPRTGVSTNMVIPETLHMAMDQWPVRGGLRGLDPGNSPSLARPERADPRCSKQPTLSADAEVAEYAASSSTPSPPASPEHRSSGVCASSEVCAAKALQPAAEEADDFTMLPDTELPSSEVLFTAPAAERGAGVCATATSAVITVDSGDDSGGEAAGRADVSADRTAYDGQHCSEAATGVQGDKAGWRFVPLPPSDSQLSLDLSAPFPQSPELRMKAVADGNGAGEMEGGCSEESSEAMSPGLLAPSDAAPAAPAPDEATALPFDFYSSSSDDSNGATAPAAGSNCSLPSGSQDSASRFQGASPADSKILSENKAMASGKDGAAGNWLKRGIDATKRTTDRWLSRSTPPHGHGARKGHKAAAGKPTRAAHPGLVVCPSTEVLDVAGTRQITLLDQPFFDSSKKKKKSMLPPPAASASDACTSAVSGNDWLDKDSLRSEDFAAVGIATSTPLHAPGPSLKRSVSSKRKTVVSLDCVSPSKSNKVGRGTPTSVFSAPPKIASKLSKPSVEVANSHEPARMPSPKMGFFTDIGQVTTDDVSGVCARSNANACNGSSTWIDLSEPQQCIEIPAATPASPGTGAGPGRWEPHVDIINVTTDTQEESYCLLAPAAVAGASDTTMPTEVDGFDDGDAGAARRDSGRHMSASSHAVSRPGTKKSGLLRSTSLDARIQTDLSNARGKDGGLARNPSLPVHEMAMSGKRQKSSQLPLKLNKSASCKTIISATVPSTAGTGGGGNADDEADSTQDFLRPMPQRVQLGEEKPYKFQAVVRKHHLRDKLPAVAETCCSKYYELGGDGQHRCQHIGRHRELHVPVSNTPDDFWNLSFPSSQTCKEKGYLQETSEAAPLRKKRKMLTSRMKSIH